MDNPSAFPEVPGDFNAYEGRPGMTLRDWFAGQAMNQFSELESQIDFESMSIMCYEFADAMLKARKK